MDGRRILLSTSDKTNPSPSEIKRARKMYKLTQTEAARLIGYSLRSWQEWEGGRRKMRSVVLDAFILIAENMKNG